MAAVEPNRDIAEAAIGPRSAVATSPDKLEECKWELEADTEKFINAIEVQWQTSQRRKEIRLLISKPRKLFTRTPGASTMC